MLFKLMVLLLGIFTVARSAWADNTFAQIREWGEVAIAVKGDYQPFGYHNVEGDLIGLEVDLAKLIAQKLGVRLRMTEATSANRLDFLQSGRVDIVLATMTDTNLRREIATIIEPRYYSSGVTLLLPTKSPIDSWEELNGKKVCVLENAFFNGDLANTYGFQAINYESTTAGIEALRDGKCIAWMFEEASILAEIAFKSANDTYFPFHSPLAATLSSPWAIAINKNDSDPSLKKALAEIFADLHRSGKLIELHQQWSMPATEYLLSMKDVWNRKGADGKFICQISEQGDVAPDDCK
jgi:polar amino acid transport system substrate-binding protein